MIIEILVVFILGCYIFGLLAVLYISRCKCFTKSETERYLLEECK